ncbi:sequestosome-1 isoform X1 [Papilio machaon]|uniref:sequestosome-1 isoform X1 n=1 Tax=Papilio machaon TaxID=76193 RepID=UPI001E665DFF|nr:sequestosome-1 isoform X1 [Papilio machaon]
MEDKVQFKVYAYGKNQTKPEVRRFGIEKSVVTSFCYLDAKLQDIYPSLKHKRFTVTWKDEDGDDITISSDDEMITALSSMTDNVMKLNIHCHEEGPQEVDCDVVITASTENATGDKNAAHCGVICDVCDVPVVGFRYKCTTCVDYDLCSKCEAAGHHSEHIMVRLPMPNMARAVIKAAIRRSRHIMKSVGSATADLEQLCKRAKRDRSCEKKRHHSRGEHHHRRNQSSWFDIFSTYMNEFADLTGNVGLDTNKDKDKTPKPAEQGSQEQPQTSDNAASSTSKQPDAAATETECPFAVNINQEKIQKFLQMLYGDTDLNSAAQQAPEQSNVNNEGDSGASGQTSEVGKEDAKSEISTTKDMNETTTRKDESPERGTDEWTVINKEKDLMDMDPKPSAPLEQNVPIGFNLPQEFQQHVKIGEGQSLYPPLHTASAVLNPKELEMLKPSQGVTKPQEAETVKQNVSSGQPKTVPLQQQPEGFKPNMSNNQTGTKQPQPQSSHIKPHIDAAIKQMLAMGFNNEGGWLTQLLQSTNGNIEAVIELLTPVKPK